MGCINTSPVIKVNSINPLKNEIKKNIKYNESEDLSNKIFNFSEDVDASNGADEQSEILIDAQIEIRH